MYKNKLSGKGSSVACCYGEIGVVFRLLKMLASRKEFIHYALISISFLGKPTYVCSLRGTVSTG